MSNMRKRSWDESMLKVAVDQSTSIRQVLFKLRLIPAGGNYEQIKSTIKLLSIDTSHFTGKLWNKGKSIPRKPIFSLKEILTRNSHFQSYKLKKRLFDEEIKKRKCEKCNWAEKSKDGRIPLELDHINGDRYDNRLSNLQVLCPNCHSLQPTHRGRNMRRRGGVIGSRV